MGGVLIVIFFFQAEDGIRDYKVTGVQTCALPIYGRRGRCGVAPDPAAGRWPMEAQPRPAVAPQPALAAKARSEEHTSELQSPCNLVCRLLLEKKKKNKKNSLLAAQMTYYTLRSSH